jgi:endonuclease-3
MAPSRSRIRPRTPAGRAREAAARLAEEYPGSAEELCALHHEGPFQLLVATILSAQCTDERVNQVTPEVFARWPEPGALASAGPDLEEVIRPTGFFNSKARSLRGMAAAVVERFEGQVPSSMADLTSLPGVGRKTANVVRSVAMGLSGLPVDTHVARLGRRLGLTVAIDPDRIEEEVSRMLPAGEWGAFSLRLILHGRAVCRARTPRCEVCVLADFCPSSSLPAGRRPAQRRGPKGSRDRKSGAGELPGQEAKSCSGRR